MLTPFVILGTLSVYHYHYLCGVKPEVRLSSDVGSAMCSVVPPGSMRSKRIQVDGLASGLSAQDDSVRNPWKGVLATAVQTSDMTTMIMFF